MTSHLQVPFSSSDADLLQFILTHDVLLFLVGKEKPCCLRRVAGHDLIVASADFVNERWELWSLLVLLARFPAGLACAEDALPGYQLGGGKLTKNLHHGGETYCLDRTPLVNIQNCYWTGDIMTSLFLLQ